MQLPGEPVRKQFDPRSQRSQYLHPRQQAHRAPCTGASSGKYQGGNKSGIDEVNVKSSASHSGGNPEAGNLPAVAEEQASEARQVQQLAQAY